MSYQNNINTGFNTQPPEGGWAVSDLAKKVDKVSTHSRPKAAGKSSKSDVRRLCCFNTQPPEGGWAGGANRL